MRFHVVGLPHTQVTLAFASCAFTEKVRKFAKMMHGLGHEVFLYAGDQSEAPCTEFVSCFTEAERKEACGGGHFIEAKFGADQPHWQRFNTRVAYEIRNRVQPHDFICLIGGTSNKPLAEKFPEIVVVEFGIGYGGTFAKCRVWESYAWMHTCYGAASKGNPNNVDGLWYDAVIPGYFEKETFPFRAEKDDYYLYVGRLTDRKGYRLAVDVCKKLGKRLIVAGHGTPPDYGEYVGEVTPERRNELMAGATALFAPTFYLEPFGNIVPEAMFCGTPVITTDWGAFTETNIHGLTGFRCRSMAEFVSAVEDVKQLDPKKIRRHAVKNYSLQVIAQKYDDYFSRLQTLHTQDGWYWLPDELRERLVEQKAVA
jgi:glycosyltransferase involved in cell wall biosynthesis